jgi:hypothetical protein
MRLMDRDANVNSPAGIYFGTSVRAPKARNMKAQGKREARRPGLAAQKTSEA